MVTSLIKIRLYVADIYWQRLECIFKVCLHATVLVIEFGIRLLFSLWNCVCRRDYKILSQATITKLSFYGLSGENYMTIAL